MNNNENNNLNQQEYNSSMNINQSNNVTRPVKKRNNNKKIIALILIAVLIIALGVFIYYKYYKSSSSTNPVPEESVDNNSNSNNNNDNNSSSSNTNEPSQNNDDFTMYIEDAFTSASTGEVVVTGKILTGSINVGDTIQISGMDQDPVIVTVERIEMFRKSLPSAEAGDNVGLIVSGVTSKQLKRGQLLKKIVTVKFEANVNILTTDEGGRNTPFFNGYHPQFQIGNVTIEGSITLPDGVEKVMPGETTKITVELKTPTMVEKDDKISIYEGSKVVATGTVTQIY